MKIKHKDYVVFTDYGTVLRENEIKVEEYISEIMESVYNGDSSLIYDEENDELYIYDNYDNNKYVWVLNDKLKEEFNNKEETFLNDMINNLIECSKEVKRYNEICASKEFENIDDAVFIIEYLEKRNQIDDYKYNMAMNYILDNANSNIDDYVGVFENSISYHILKYKTYDLIKKLYYSVFLILPLALILITHIITGLIFGKVIALIVTGVLVGASIYNDLKYDILSSIREKIDEIEELKEEELDEIEVLDNNIEKLQEKSVIKNDEASENYEECVEEDFFGFLISWINNIQYKIGLIDNSTEKNKILVESINILQFFNEVSKTIKTKEDDLSLKIDTCKRIDKLNKKIDALLLEDNKEDKSQNIRKLK